MGFLRRIFGGKKHHNPPPGSSNGSGSKHGKDKRTWSFAKNSTREKSNKHSDLSTSSSSAPFTDSLDSNKHAIAVAAATAAVAEAALAAAHAAAEVVRLTSATGAGSSTSTAKSQRRTAEEITAAVKIQSAFRGYLARRALRALKALVRLQALVRGHIVRKQTADMLRRMQTLVRLQARARATRVHLSDHNMQYFKPSHSHYPVPKDYDHSLRAYSTKFDRSSILKRCSSNANFRDIDLERARFGSNWPENWMEENAWSQTGDASLKNGHPEDDNSDKILEVDTWKPHLKSHHSSSSFQSAHHYLASDYNNNENFMAHESPPSKRSSKALNSRTAECSPQTFSASNRLGSGARRGPFTPTKSECSWGIFSGYSSHPNYMANTESSRAKVRSLSAPRQRLEFERYGSNRSVQSLCWDIGPNSYRESEFRSEAHPTSTRLNRNGSSNIR